MTEEWFFECLRIDKEPSSILVRLLVSSYDIDYFNSERRPLSAKEVSKLV